MPRIMRKRKDGGSISGMGRVRGSKGVMEHYIDLECGHRFVYQNSGPSTTHHAKEFRCRECEAERRKHEH